MWLFLVPACDRWSPWVWWELSISKEPWCSTSSTLWDTLLCASVFRSRSWKNERQIWKANKKENNLEMFLSFLLWCTSMYHSKKSSSFPSMILSISSWHFCWCSGYFANMYSVQARALPVVSCPEQQTKFLVSFVCLSWRILSCSTHGSGSGSWQHASRWKAHFTYKGFRIACDDDSEALIMFFTLLSLLFSCLLVPSNKNVSTSAWISWWDSPVPSESLAVSRMSKKSRYLRFPKNAFSPFSIWKKKQTTAAPFLVTPCHTKRLLKLWQKQIKWKPAKNISPELPFFCWWCRWRFCEQNRNVVWTAFLASRNCRRRNPHKK